MSKQRTLSEAQFKKLIRSMARKAIKEQAQRRTKAKRLHEAKKKAAAAKRAKQQAPQKITAKQLREMVRESIVDCLNEELDKKLKTNK